MHEETALGLQDQLSQAARTAARLSKIVELALADADLSLPQYRLMILLTNGSTAATGLAERLMVTRPSITALTDGLVQRGYVERRPDLDDRRRMAHTLTPAGHAALDRGDQAIQDRMADLVSHLPAEQADTALRSIGLWTSALDTSMAHRARLS